MTETASKLNLSPRDIARGIVLAVEHHLHHGRTYEECWADTQKLWALAGEVGSFKYRRVQQLMEEELVPLVESRVK